MSAVTSGNTVYDALVLVLPAHIIVHVRDIIDNTETVNDAVQSIKRYIEDEIAAATASGVWYADAWKSFGDAVELLLHSYGDFVVSEWLSRYIRHLLSYSPTSRISQFVAVVRSGAGMLMQMGAITDSDGNLQSLVTVERPLCGALQQLIVFDDWEYVWLIDRAIHYTTADETRHFIHDVMRAAQCIKPVKLLSEFLP